MDRHRKWMYLRPGFSPSSSRIMDPMLRSRTYRIEMAPNCQPEAIAHRDPQFTPWPESKDQVRDDAYLWAFQNMQVVDARYRGPDMEPPKQPFGGDRSTAANDGVNGRGVGREGSIH